ncbi:MAG: GIY-YIG nuclease family protein [Bacteroidota bacterium]
MTHFVYILRSNKLNRFYVGETSNLNQRLKFHENSLPHKFTAKAKDWVLFFKIECSNKLQALAIERHIKRMKSKTYIENLKKYPEIIQKLLAKYQ